VEVGADSGQDHDAYFHSKHAVPSRRLAALRCKDIPDAGYQEHGVGRTLNVPERSCNLLGRTPAEGPQRWEKAGHYKLTTHPNCRGENMERQASGLESVGEGGELHIGSF
jgi:hypothetical protein